MKLKKLACTLLLAVQFIGFGYAQGISGQKMVADTSYLIGKLENGLTYYIKSNKKPAGYAEFFIIHNVGSLQEEPNQRGLAHFLEHMAFNGTKNFPDKSLLNSLGERGVKFGANVNAYTSQDRTVYNISQVPVKRGTLVDSVLLMLHDWSSYISCEPDEIEAERGVIREEWRRGDDSRSRMLKAVNRFEQAGSRFAERDVIGLPEIINTFKPQTLVDFYHKWYRPDLQAIVVVGDIHPADIEARIKNIFSNIPAVKNGAVREKYAIDYTGKNQIEYFSDPETKAYCVKLSVRYPFPNDLYRGSNRYFEQNVITDLIKTMINNRFSQMQKEKQAKFKNCVIVSSRIYYDCNVLRFTLVPNAGRFEEGATVLLNEMNRMARLGFTQEEVDVAKEELRPSYVKMENLYAKGISNKQYVDMVVENFTRQFPLVDYKDMYTACLGILDEVQKEEVNAFLREKLPYDNSVLIFIGSEKDARNFPSKERMLSVSDSVKQSAVVPFELKESKPFEFNETLVSKAVGQPEPYAKVDSAVLFKLDHGTAVYWKQTADHGDKTVYMTAIREGGLRSGKAENMPLAKIVVEQMPAVGFAGMTYDDAQRFFKSNKMKMAMEVSTDYDRYNGSFEVDKAETFFQVLYSRFTDPCVDTKRLGRFIEAGKKMMKEGQAPMRLFADSCRQVLYEPTPLFVKPSLEDWNAVKAQDVQDFYQKHLASRENMIFMFYGPMSAEEARPYIETYIANLPVRSASGESARMAPQTLKRGTNDLTYRVSGLKSTKAKVDIDVYAFFDFNLQDKNALRFLMYILRDRYMNVIREEKGGTYTVDAQGEFRYEPEEGAFINVNFETDPKLVPELVDCVWDELHAIVKKGVTEAEVERIKKYLLKNISQKGYSDMVWMARIYNNLKYNEYLDMNDVAAVKAVTSGEIRKMAKKIMAQKNYSTKLFIPEL